MDLAWYDRVPWPGVWADLMLALHVVIVLFLVLGQLLVLIGWCQNWQWTRNLWFRLTHLVTIGFVIAQTWLGQLCPLTIWEQQLRMAAGQSIYQESFIQHWLGRLIFFDLPWWVFIAAYSMFGLLVLLSWWRYPPRWPQRSRLKWL